MPKKSAGILMFQRPADQLKVLLVHPGGPFWQNRDEGAWSIPKGEFVDGENPFEAAKREFEEELGMPLVGQSFCALTPLRQPSGKIVHAWAVEGDCDVTSIRSNLFAMEWPRHSGKMQEFPEIDRAGWFPVDSARQQLLRGQVGFIDELERILGTQTQSDLRPKAQTAQATPAEQMSWF